MQSVAAILLCCVTGQVVESVPAGLEEPLRIEAPAAVPTVRLGADYVYWFLRKIRVPPLLTTGPAGTEAVLGQQGVAVVYDQDGRLDSRHDDRYIGLRLHADLWLNDDQTFGLQASAFFLERDSAIYREKNHQGTPLARPYIDAATGQPQSWIIAGYRPGVGDLVGSFYIYSRIELFGQELNTTWVLAREETWTFTGLLGGRFLQNRERLDITTTGRLLPDQAVLYGLTDHFRTFNNFYGAQMGLQGDARLFERLTVGGRATVALGADHQTIRIYGDQLFQTPLERRMTNYGLYATPSNTGTFERIAFDSVWEMSLNMKYDLTRHLALRAGYTFLVWANPVRPGDQITPIHLPQPSVNNPQAPFQSDLFWAHGANVGLEIRW